MAKSVKDIQRPKKKPLWPLFVMLSLLGLLTWVDYKAGSGTFMESVEKVGLMTAQVIGAFSTIFVGTFLYFFRCRWPYSYGILEILVGVFGAIYVAAQLVEPTGGRGMLVFAEIAALYVIVRGWDNVARSLSGEQKESWDRFFFGAKAG